MTWTLIGIVVVAFLIGFLGGRMCWARDRDRDRHQAHDAEIQGD